MGLTQCTCDKAHQSSPCTKLNDSLAFEGILTKYLKILRQKQSLQVHT